MLLIKSIEVEEVLNHGDHPVQVAHWDPIHVVPLCSDKWIPPYCDVRTEMVIPVCYHLPDGTERVIGMTQAVQEHLGFTMDNVRKMGDRVYSLTVDNENLDRKLRVAQGELVRFKTMTFWKRVRYLFLGKL